MAEDADSTNPSDEPILYAVRVSESAGRELDEVVSQMGNRDSAAAREWYRGIAGVIRGLSENPRRFAMQSEESRKLGGEVRRERFGFYYLFYRVRDETEDGPRVTIIHIRHTSRKPITRAEAKDIRAGE